MKKLPSFLDLQSNNRIIFVNTFSHVQPLNQRNSDCNTLLGWSPVFTRAHQFATHEPIKYA